MMQNDSSTEDRPKMVRGEDGGPEMQRPEWAPPPAVSASIAHKVTERQAGAALLGVPKASAHMATDTIESFVEEMGPRNHAERMLAVQMVYQHLRISQLCRQRSEEPKPERRRRMDAAIDSAMNIYRRQTETWDRLHRPRSVNLVSGQQVNMADQQIVANSCDGRSNSGSPFQSNEQGSGHVAEQEAIPADTGGAGGAPGCGPQQPAVGKQHGASDA